MSKYLLLFLVGLTVTINVKDEIDKLIFMHEFVRGILEIDLLTPSTDLEKIAQSYAETLEENPENLLKTHSGNTYKGSELGENIYVGKNQEGISEVAVETWLDEGEIYYENPENYKLAQHFTQLVWKSTKLIGCGMSCNTDKCYIVCNYYPAGNVINEYDNNVIPLHKIMEIATKVNVEVKDTPLEKFRKEMTEKHNKYRKEHNAGELERDSKLEKIAQENAENMLETDSTFYTTEKYDGEKVGQNIFYGIGDIDADKIIEKWYSKKKFYDFDKPGSEENKSAQQFINLVWKETKKIGCGYACNKRECFATCVYYPSGGCEYIYIQNVLPEKE